MPGTETLPSLTAAARHVVHKQLHLYHTGRGKQQLPGIRLTAQGKDETGRDKDENIYKRWLADGIPEVTLLRLNT